MCLVIGMQMLKYVSSSLFYKIDNIEYDGTPPSFENTLSWHDLDTNVYYQCFIFRAYRSNFHL